MDDELDIEQPQALERYLRATRRIDDAESIEVKVLPGGVSNRTVWVRRESGETWVMKQALAKLRVKVDWFSDPRRIEREAMGLRWLAKLAPQGTITPLAFEDHEQHLLAMEAVPEPHENWKTMLLRGEVNLERHVAQFGLILALIHRKSSERAAKLREVFDDRSFFESLRIEPYYLYAAQQEPRAAAFLNSLVDQTRRTRVALVHGDYSPKNVLIRNENLVLLDHEVIHWGDPAFDVGFAMTHLLSKGHHLIAHRKAFTKSAISFWANYSTYVGEGPRVTSLEERAVKHTLGCLLARVCGRSQLEYLNDAEKARQREIVVEMMACAPKDICDLVATFMEKIRRD